ncbi:MAG TPA: DUF5996 family protein [Candidatus Dormibacteraeota bacterium]|nr:DUF5996 family protein [Candidatus Dormibacteraeota bacterium]
MSEQPQGAEDWPALPYEEWRETRDTLHMYTQVLGKLRLALSPFEPEWANVPLYVSARGLSTSSMPYGLRTVDAELDLIDHELVLRSSDGAVRRRPLGGSVADFFTDVMRELREMGVDAEISAVPSEVAHAIPFADDREHVMYDARAARRFFDVLSRVDVVLKEHHAAFRGRYTPVQFFWGTFDLALTRYSGRPVQVPEGTGVIGRFGGDAEEICAGWWPGDGGNPFPAFYAYAYPKPDGIGAAEILPAVAAWSDGAGEFLLPYDMARAEPDPRRAMREFLDSTYAVAASLMRWDPELAHVAAPRHTAAHERKSGVTA